VKQLVPDRDMVLRNELMRQQNNERLRRAFAQKANVVGQWIERHLDAVATASMQRGKLEDNLSRLYALDKEIATFRPNMDELERYNQDIHEAMIFDNRHTPYTMEVSLRRLFAYVTLHVQQWFSTGVPRSLRGSVSSYQGFHWWPVKYKNNDRNR